MKKLSKYQCFKAHSGVTVVRRGKKYNLQQVTSPQLTHLKMVIQCIPPSMDCYES